MSFTTQHLFTNSPPTRLPLHFAASASATVTTTRTAAFFPLPPLNPQNLHFRALINPLNLSPQNSNFPLKAYHSDDPIINPPTYDNFNLNLDAFLSLAEFFFIFSSAIIMVSYAVNCTVKKTVLGVVGSKAAIGWGAVAVVGGVAAGAWLRRRQWRRVCVEVVRGRESVNLVERIEKLEEDLRSSATIIRVLSRQLEKLGIRFRVTRKTLKDPIAETAALVQKNSEATRALAMQEDILEKELVEIQKVMLAMQEQQQKQLELILAIGKAGKLWENRNQEQDVIEKSDLTGVAKQLETHETQTSTASKGTNNDRP